MSLQVNQPLTVSPGKGFNAVALLVGGLFTFGFAILSSLPTSRQCHCELGYRQHLIMVIGFVASGSRCLPVAMPSTTAGLAISANKLAAGVYSASLVVTDSFGAVLTVPFSLSIGQPIIQNGGFETVDFTDWTLSCNTASTGVTFRALCNSELRAFGLLRRVFGTAIGARLFDPEPRRLRQGRVMSFRSGCEIPAEAHPILLKYNGMGSHYFRSQTSPARAGRIWCTSVTATGSGRALQFTFGNDPDYFSLDDVSVAIIEQCWLQLHDKIGQQFPTRLGRQHRFGLSGPIQNQFNAGQLAELGKCHYRHDQYTFPMTDTNAFKKLTAAVLLGCRWYSEALEDWRSKLNRACVPGHCFPDNPASRKMTLNKCTS